MYEENGKYYVITEYLDGFIPLIKPGIYFLKEENLIFQKSNIKLKFYIKKI